MRLLILYLLLILSVTGFSQSAGLYFRNLNTANGLSHNKVNCILQDRRGFLWIGTDDGLNRYDGNKFLVFRTGNGKASISGNIITDLHEDSSGVLWIGSADGGLCRYDYRLPPDDQFRRFRYVTKDTTMIPGDLINAIMEDRGGFLWIATSGKGVLRFNKKTEQFLEPVRTRPRTNLSLEMDSEGRIWVGRQGGGIMKIEPRSMRYEEDMRYANVYAKLPHMNVAALFHDSRQNMWIGSWDKVLYKIHVPTGEEEVMKKTPDPFSFSGGDALCFAEDTRHNIWIGGKANGLHIYDPVNNSFHNYRHDPAREGTLPHNQVNSIYIDRSGLVWVGTNRGLSVHDPAQQQFRQTFLPPYPGQLPGVNDFLRLSDGRLLIASANGLYVQTPGGSISHHRLHISGQSPELTRLHMDAQGVIYAGTNVSLYKLDAERYTLSLIPNTQQDTVMGKIIESRIVSMLDDTIDGQRVLLASPYGHYMAYYDFSRSAWVTRKDSVRAIISRFNLKDNLIRKFFRARDGTVWIATTKMGLGRWSRKPFSRITYFTNIPGDPRSISNNNVSDIAEDFRGNLWISTYGGGLHYFNTSNRQFTPIEGSPNLLEGLQMDKLGNVWMIANGNVHKYDPHRGTFSSFELPDLEKTGGVRGHIRKDVTGKMYLGGDNYFIAFHPDSIREINAQPQVYLTDFRIFNTSHSHLLSQKEIVLDYNQNFFTLEFSAPGYQAGFPVQYAHKLDGVDADWVEDGTGSVVPYTNLDGGIYTFHVRATVKPGVWGEQVSTIRIRIIPPFWKTPLFYIICVVIAGLVIYGIYRYRINELLKRQAIRNKIAQDLHDNVGSTLSSISVYSQVAKIYKQQDKSDALQETLEKISSTSGEMISEMNDIVWAINPRNDNMQTILQRMESYARPLLTAQEIRLHFDYEPGIESMHLEMTKRKNFYLIFKEAVNNAMKYSGCRNLHVTIRRQQHLLRLEVQDDGNGFDIRQAGQTSSLSGNGLRNMELRTKEMKGKLNIVSMPGEGTTIALEFPIP